MEYVTGGTIVIITYKIPGPEQVTAGAETQITTHCRIEKERKWGARWRDTTEKV